MQKTITKYLSGSILAIALMGANVLNFIFNAFLGRTISYEELGSISFIGTLFYICTVFYNSLSFIVNHQTAILDRERVSEEFSSYVTRRILLLGIILFLLWIICSPLIANAFHVNNIFVIAPFSLVLLLYPLNFVYRGYFQGKFFFYSCAFVIIFEPISKLIFAAAFVLGKAADLTFLSVYLSALITVLVAYGIFLFHKPKQHRMAKKQFSFPTKLFISALAGSISTIPFLALDLILVKHFLSPKLSGQYALLTLVGKIIYFSGSLLSIFIVSLVGRDEARNVNPIHSFYKILGGSIVAGGLAYILLGIFGFVFAPLLFGRKILVLIPYLNTYCLSILLFTIGTAIITFHLAKKQYIFPIASLIISIFVIAGIMFFHQNIREIINILFVTSIASSLILLFLHLKKRNESVPVLLADVLEKEEYYA